MIKTINLPTKLNHAHPQMVNNNILFVAVYIGNGTLRIYDNQITN